MELCACRNWSIDTPKVAEKEVKFNNDEMVGDSAYTYSQDFDNMSRDLPDNPDYIRNM